MALRALVWGLLLGVFASAAPGWIVVGKGGAGFALTSGATFTPWGFNYDRDYRYRLLEDYWDAEWSTVEGDFREMKRLGANLVRVHLQFAKFMDGSAQPNAANLARLEKLLAFAEEIGLYLDITGLGTYRASDMPAWYRGLAEQDRWAAQARFWEAVASTCASHAGVFSYNLMNEPVASGERRPAGQWVLPSAIQGLQYVEFINLDPAGRKRPDIARDWLRRMVQAVRKHDQHHLVTVGMIWIDPARPEDAAGFPPSKIAPEVDFLAVHVYPEKGKVSAALNTLSHYKAGKPLLIEEMYPLKCDLKELGTFIDGSHGIADGWLGFYWGKTLDEWKDSSEPAGKQMYRWLALFQTLAPNRAR